MYTRRGIGRLALASLPLTRAFAKLDSRVHGVLIGAQSYSFRDRPSTRPSKALSTSA